ncbi:hypothetical protein H6P81_020051 [Aristolochia fimbriata]|uniref:Wbp11/ELF5/Saf1 N-terminal domain-containing protein n=1 Tax=Aristolochia fimbriata TaxID=158543 RepID=A0AAV7DWM9_ARIFI|nr:hypothetical protein H6P81_020051 [Aristolochia fimbriata]
MKEKKKLDVGESSKSHLRENRVLFFLLYLIKLLSNIWKRFGYKPKPDFIDLKWLCSEQRYGGLSKGVGEVRSKVLLILDRFRRPTPENKKERKKVREVGILKKDPETLRKQSEKLEMMSPNTSFFGSSKYTKILFMGASKFLEPSTPSVE